MSEDWYARHRRRIERRHVVRLVADYRITMTTPPWVQTRKAYIRFVSKAILNRGFIGYA